MSDQQPFEGFSAEGIGFLSELAQNNNKEWFDANKQRYIDLLQKPAVSLVATLGKRLQDISDGIRYDTRTNGSGSLMRINRDVRFSKDKSPYKTNIAMMFWEGTGKKMENPGFGIQITANVEDSGLMTGQFGFSKEMVITYREAVHADETGDALVSAVEAVRSAGDYTLNGEQLKRVPREYDAEHPRGELLRYKGLWFSYSGLTLDDLTSPELVDICYEHFRNMSPVQQWLVKIAP